MENEDEGGKVITPVDYVVMNDPTREALLNKISELENADDSEVSPEDIESSSEKLCLLYDLLENEGQAAGRAANILKELGTHIAIFCTIFYQLADGLFARMVKDFLKNDARAHSVNSVEGGKCGSPLHVRFFKNPTSCSLMNQRTIW